MAIVVLVFGYIGAWLSPTDQYACGGGSRENLARIMVQEYANQAYARWLMNHPEERYPVYIDELARYTGDVEPLDPWGTRLEMVCAPPVGRFGVVSAGPDRKFRTVDDIHSWEERP